MRWIAAIALLPFAVLSAAAQEDSGCNTFAWSVARERGWFAAPDKPNLAAGEKLTAFPAAAFVVRLLPNRQATFAMPPERKAKSPEGFGGAVWFPAIQRAGIYQITLSEEAWIDVVQDGRYARSVGSTGRSDCPGLRKSVRLELVQAPFTLQLSGVGSDTVNVAIGPRD